MGHQCFKFEGRYIIHIMTISVANNHNYVFFFNSLNARPFEFFFFFKIIFNKKSCKTYAPIQYVVIQSIKSECAFDTDTIMELWWSVGTICAKCSRLGLFSTNRGLCLKVLLKEPPEYLPIIQTPQH